METKSPSYPRSAGAESVLLRDAPLSLDEAIAAVAGRGFGAVVTFSGTIRDREGDSPIAAIHYQAYSGMAVQEMGRIIANVQERGDVKAVLRHRVGRVPVGEAAVVVAVAAAHRREAFAACQYIMDRLKEKVPIWKIEHEAAR